MPEAVLKKTPSKPLLPKSPLSSSSELNFSQDILPRYTVVFDIDETLAWYDTTKKSFVPRPHLQRLVAFLNKHVDRIETVVWTHGQRAYAQPFVKEMFSCAVYSVYYELGGDGVKSLESLGRPLDLTLIVENNAANVVHDQHHAVVVPDFKGLRPKGTRDDDVLLRVVALLKELLGSDMPVPDALLASSMVFKTGSGFLYLK
jgi:hypothetical protein